MANNLWAGAVRMGLAANRPTVPDFPSDTFGFYYATDTAALSFGISGGGAWIDLATAMGGAILSALPTTDPGNAGDIWNDGGVLKVSEGGG